MVTKKSTPSWSDVKTRLADFDRAGLLGLLQDLYAANKDNQAFLHARLSLGDDVLKPYKVTIDRWLWPDVVKNQDISVARAKKPIADYKKAIGQPEGLAELMVFYCERAAGFSMNLSHACRRRASSTRWCEGLRAGVEDRRQLAADAQRSARCGTRLDTRAHGLPGLELWCHADSPRWPAANYFHECGPGRHSAASRPGNARSAVTPAH